MEAKKILVVDTDIVVRRAVGKILQERSEHHIILSGDIKNTVGLIEKTEPDLLLLAVRLSKVEELALISGIRTRFSGLPLVMLTERGEEGAVVAISALRLGAVDFITKPSSANSLLFSDTHLSKRLLPVLSAALKSSPARSREEISGQRSLFRNPEEIEPEFEESSRRAEIICVGGCTGGAVALFDLIQGLPGYFPAPILVAQHFPAIYTKVLAEKLDEVSDLTVREGEDGELLEPGTVYVIPGGYHGEAERYGDRTFLKLHRGPRHHGFRPSIDLTFRSVGHIFGRNSLGVILSGISQDGVAGVGMIQDSGGQIFVQSPRSSLVYELPMAVLKKGYGNACYPIEEMSRQLVGRVSSSVFEESKMAPLRYTSGFQTSKRQDKYLFGIS